MTRRDIGLVAACAYVVFAVACGSKAETVKAEDAKDVAAVDSTASEYLVSVDETVLEWKASKLGGSSHNGKIKLASGSLSVVAQQIKAGKFDVDMNSIQVDDITDPGQNAKLVGHLRSEDFFAVDSHPVSTFEITEVEKGQADSSSVKGNLTIKGITKNIAIPAKVSVDDNSASVSASFSIDRTEWDIKYNSGKFFTSLGDNAINDAIEFKLTLKANKQ